MTEGKNESEHTPTPWKWQGEDYRGGWGWQLLVGPNDEGIICGEGKDGPYEHLRAYIPIDPIYTKTGMESSEESAPAIHILQKDAEFLLEAVNSYDSLRAEVDRLTKEKTEAIKMLEIWVDEIRSDIDNASGYKKQLLTNSKSLLTRIK